METSSVFTVSQTYDGWSPLRQRVTACPQPQEKYVRIRQESTILIVAVEGRTGDGATVQSRTCRRKVSSWPGTAGSSARTEAGD